MPRPRPPHPVELLYDTRVVPYAVWWHCPACNLEGPRTNGREALTGAREHATTPEHAEAAA